MKSLILTSVGIKQLISRMILNDSCHNETEFGD